MGKGSAMSDDELIERAKKARLAAHAPYSHFEVGAALLTTDGRVYTGCNIENSAYGLSMCAERMAIFRTVTEGAEGILKVAVASEREIITPPCGCCSQRIWEFASEETDVI